jgi:hypothetical protein
MPRRVKHSILLQYTHATVKGSGLPFWALPAAGQPALKADTSATNATESVNDLRLHIRELTNTNLDLRSSLKEQSGTIVKLQANTSGFVTR